MGIENCCAERSKVKQIDEEAKLGDKSGQNVAQESSKEQESKEDGKKSQTIDKDYLKIPTKAERVETQEDMKRLLKENFTQILRGFSAIECSGNSYSIEAAQNLAMTIKNSAKPDFYFADFSNMFIARQIEDIPVALKFLLAAIVEKPVTTLCLNDNAIGVRVVQQSGLLTFLTQNKHINNLNLSNCGLSSESMKLLFEETLASSNTQLKELRISRNALKSGGALALSKYLETYDKLELLEISGCRIEKDGMQPLLDSLLPSAKSGSLRHLDIRDNNVMNEEAADSLAELITNAQNMEFLNIGDSNITEEEAQAKIVQAMNSGIETTSKLCNFMWDYDLDGQSENAETLAHLLANFAQIQEVSLHTSISSKTKRDEIRKLYKAKGKVIFLTDNDKEFDEESESD